VAEGKSQLILLLLGHIKPTTTANSGTTRGLVSATLNLLTGHPPRTITVLCRFPENFAQKPKVFGELSLMIHQAMTRDDMDISWLCDSERKSNVCLITEPRVPRLYFGEGCRAAVLAGILSDAQRFGHFFADSMSSSSAYDIFSLVSGLAVSYPPFRHALTRILIDDPGILELSAVRTRFKKLIHEPWKALRESHPQYALTPPVVILRFNSKRHGKELFRPICQFGSMRHSSPLLWITSVCPSFQLPIQDSLDLLMPVRYFRLPVCYSEGAVDTALVLHHKFTAFRHKHKEVFDDNEVWPSEEQMSQMTSVVSGVFELIDVIIQFIDWMDDGGPRAHLQTFLAYMVDFPSPSDDRRFSLLTTSIFARFRISLRISF
jgi:hypothetical protein